MRNILSYQYGCLASGKEIIEWAKYHSNNTTSHAKAGRYILKHYKIHLDKMYRVYSNNTAGTGCGKIKKIPLIIRA